MTPSTSSQRQIELLKLIEEHTGLLDILIKAVTTQAETIIKLEAQIRELQKRSSLAGLISRFRS